jgi:hypothetical protein
MRNFKINYKVGLSIRTDEIQANDLDEAVSKADVKHPSWVDVILVKPMLEKAMAMAFCILSLCNVAHADIAEDKAVHCILGEARSEGEIGIKALAEALKNRNTTKGVYGCNVDFSKEAAYIKAKRLDVIAKQAWRDAPKLNLVKNADHWENITAFGTPTWAKKMVKTTCINHHCFYRSK